MTREPRDGERKVGSEALSSLRTALAPTEGRRSDDLAVAGAAALVGGKAALAHYGEPGLDVRRKAGGAPVTIADDASNRAILSFLAEHRPEDPVLSEESGRSERPSGAAPRTRLWLVDPLDGTKEFVARNGEFSVMVGLAEGGAASLGAVYQPAPDLLYLGVAEGGAWLMTGASPLGKPGRSAGLPEPLRAEAPPEGPLRFVRSRSHGDPRLRRLQEALGEVEVVLSGSVGIKCALIASGRGDVYVHPVPYLKEWDTCAPEAVLRGAGGRVTDCAGRPLRYGKTDPHQAAGIFAAPPGLWERLAPLVREVWPELSPTG